MKSFTIALLLILAITFAQAATNNKGKGVADAVKEKIHDATEAVKDKLNLHLDEKGLPKQAGETAGDVKEGIDHATNAANDAASIPHDSLKDKIHDAVDAVKETLKLTKSGAEVAKDAQGVPIEGAKDAAKEGIHLSKSGDKVEEVKEFVKDEVIETRDAVVEGLGLNEEKGTIKTVIDSAKKTVEHATEVIKEKLNRDGGEKVEEQPQEPEQPQGTVNKVIDSAKQGAEHAQQVIKEKLHVGGAEQAQEAQQPAEPAQEPTIVDQIKDHIYRYAETIKQTVGIGNGNSSQPVDQGNDDDEL